MTGAHEAATQTRHPWRATLRTAFALLVAGLSLLPEVLAAADLDGTVIGAQTLVVTAAVTRVLALPAVDTFLARWVPWLAAEPPTTS